MSSSASDLIKFEKQATGENASTWGTKANTAMSRIEEAIAGMTTVTVTGSNYTLDDTQYVENSSTTAESHLHIIKTTGTLTGNRDLIVPARTKTYLIWNGNGGAYTLTAKTASGSGVIIPQGGVQYVYCDGTNVEAASLGISNDGTKLLDTNGNELVTLATIASAINEFTISNAAAGNGPQLEATGGDTNIDIELIPKGTGIVKSGATAVGLAGVHSVPIPATGMYTTTTNGAAAGSSESSTHAVMIKTWDFDASTDEYVQFQVPMPKSWKHDSTITAKFYWSHAATSTNFGVSWGIQALGFGDSDALDGTAWPTGVVVDDTGGTTDDVFVSAATSAVTPGGTLAAEDIILFRVYRDVSDTNDTMAIDARLHAVKLDITTDLGNDA
tara:strand:- start:5009 stop:6166 length:1158 start_codon:yes stop_codon:yes gene_type:complete